MSGVKTTDLTLNKNVMAISNKEYLCVIMDDEVDGLMETNAAIIVSTL